MAKEIRIRIELIDGEDCLLKEEAYLPSCYAMIDSFQGAQSQIADKILRFWERMERDNLFIEEEEELA